MKKNISFLSLVLLASLSTNLYAQQNKNDVRKPKSSNFFDNIQKKGKTNSGWSRTIPQGSSMTKNKKTNTSFYRPYAAGIQQYDYSSSSFMPADSHLYYWNTNHGENENLIMNYNELIYYKSGLGFDLENIDKSILSNMEYLDFFAFPLTDSIVIYYDGTYDFQFNAHISNSKIDSLSVPSQQGKLINEYDANNNIRKQTTYQNANITMIDSAIFSATNKKLSHYRYEDYGSSPEEYINTFTYDANDKVIEAYFAIYENNNIDYEFRESTFTLSTIKDSIVSYENYGSGFETTSIKVNFHTNGVSDSIQTYYPPFTEYELNVFYRNTNDQVINFAKYTSSDTSNIYIIYNIDNQIESAYSTYTYGGNEYYYRQEVYEYDTLGNIVTYKDFGEYDDVNNIWNHGYYDRMVNFYYELYTEPCLLSIAYNRLDPNDSLCTDIELTFTGETLPIDILVTTPNNPTGVSHTITTLPFVISDLCPDQYTITAEDDKGCADTLTFAIQDLTSIHDAYLDNQVSVYPNPAKDMVRIEGIKVGATLTLVDMFGRKLTQTIATATTHQLDVSKLASGMYTIQIRLDGGIANKKIIVDK